MISSEDSAASVSLVFKYEYLPNFSLLQDIIFLHYILVEEVGMSDAGDNVGDSLQCGRDGYDLYGDHETGGEDIP